jgi:hypothetical protein
MLMPSERISSSLMVSKPIDRQFEEVQTDEHSKF